MSKPKTKQLEIKPAKGRPMLSWVGKRPLRHVTAFPAQHTETFDPTGDTAKRKGAEWQEWPKDYPKGGLLFHGDNKEVLAHLLANGFRGKVNLIYIDPPFDSGADYVRKINLRGVKGETKIEGDSYTLGEQVQYTDIWANDNYLQFMYERLLLLKELLAANGSIYVHMNDFRVAPVRLLMDEVFGAESFRNIVVWYFTNKIPDSRKKLFTNSTEFVLFYTKGDGSTFHTLETQREKPIKVSKMEKVEGKKIYTKDESGKGIYVERTTRIMDNVWNIALLHAQPEREDYPTQKPEDLLRRVIMASSDPSDIVLDCFVGSGTTSAVAQRLGRRWIGCDINKGAIQTTSKRLQTIIAEQVEAAKQRSRQGKLIETETNEAPPPAQLSFATYRVNDYDLQIQHNEAVNLACEHIGVTRTRTDSYFDGTLGKRLVKIAPFTHPLSLLDMEELKKELAARPDEERDVTVVCLGKETAVDGWLEDWNRLRKKGDVPNKIEVIELRTDPTYGKFFVHQPARAKVEIKRTKDKILIVIEDFISPTIIERLTEQAGILKPKIDNWRAMVDCVSIDAAYDGKVFNVALSDVPEKKTKLVTGKYELPAPRTKTTVAVKIVDMLGEEVLVTKAL